MNDPARNNEVEVLAKMDPRTLWLFCWCKSAPLQKCIDKNIARLIALMLPRTYYYEFTDCVNLSGGHLATCFRSQKEFESSISKCHPTHMRKSELPWYSSGMQMEYDLFVAKQLEEPERGVGTAMPKGL